MKNLLSVVQRFYSRFDYIFIQIDIQILFFIQRIFPVVTVLVKNESGMHGIKMWGTLVGIS